MASNPVIGILLPELPPALLLLPPPSPPRPSLFKPPAKSESLVLTRGVIYLNLRNSDIKTSRKQYDLCLAALND